MPASGAAPIPGQRPNWVGPRLRPSRLALIVIAVLLTVAAALTGMWHLDRYVQRAGVPTGQAPLLVVGTSGPLALIPTAEGGALTPPGGQTVHVRGHAAPIRAVGVVNGGTVLLTTDAVGATQLTPLAPQAGLAAVETSGLADRLEANLILPLRASVQAVPAPVRDNALWAALALTVLALGAAAGPQVAAYAGGWLVRRTAPREPAPLPSGPPAPAPVVQPPRAPGSRWRQPIDGLPAAATPEMVTLPPGRFVMGAPADEEGSRDSERPQREVSIGYAFALGRVPVTFAEWDAAIAAGAKLPTPEDRGWRRDNRPVIHVSWEDVQAYVVWLNERAGLAGRRDAYRLPSEAEWEYACRAGTTTPFSFGETISTDQANYDGNHTYGSGAKGVYREQTTPVGSFPANGFGLQDMHGNVWEWCQDVWKDNYTGAPSDGSANTTAGSSNRVLRGGSWDVTPQGLRSANRIRYIPILRDDYSGFRLARTL